MPRVVLVSNIRDSEGSWRLASTERMKATTHYDVESHNRCNVYGLTPPEEESLLKAVSDSTLDQDTPYKPYKRSPESSLPFRTLDKGAVIKDFPESILSQLYSFGYEIICCNSHPIHEEKSFEVLWTLVKKNC